MHTMGCLGGLQCCCYGKYTGANQTKAPAILFEASSDQLPDSRRQLIRSGLEPTARVLGALRSVGPGPGVGMRPRREVHRPPPNTRDRTRAFAESAREGGIGKGGGSRQESCVGVLHQTTRPPATCPRHSPVLIRTSHLSSAAARARPRTAASPLSRRPPRRRCRSSVG